ncbi:MAG: thioesterase [Ferruginibacter sp.]
MTSSPNKFIDLVQNPVKFIFFLISRLPAAYFSGVRLKYADENQSVVTVPYKWFSKNPFRSTYFACLSMAAEMSTGILAMAQIYKREPPISLLVIKTEGTFLKKATGITIFTCNDGAVFQQAVNEAAASGKSTTVAARSTGKDKNGDIIAEFVITWSFKAKSK